MKAAQRSIISFSFVVLCVYLVSCTMERNNNAKAIHDLISHFRDNGLDVGSLTGRQPNALGAVSGCAVYVEGDEVEIYKYDNSDESERKLLEKYKIDGTITIMGSTVPIKVNGSFVLLFYQSNPKKDLLLKAFESF